LAAHQAEKERGAESRATEDIQLFGSAVCDLSDRSLNQLRRGVERSGPEKRQVETVNRRIVNSLRNLDGGDHGTRPVIASKNRITRRPGT
jgi:hypothetical protein